MRFGATNSLYLIPRNLEKNEGHDKTFKFLCYMRNL